MYRLFTIVLILQACWLSAQNFANGFNFALPPFDSTVSNFLPQFPAYRIEAMHRVSANGSGQFQLPDGTPIRFWGVNITAAGAFPSKDRAPAIAARLRKMGVNLVRFHHLENNWTGDNGCIFLYAQGTRKLNPVTLDRLEYFIAQLRRNGIYVNMNLNVSRIFKESDGVRGADSLPEFAKGVTLFDPQLQQLQREYAQQLLGHVNPYTGVSLAADPVLAMVEMNNENTIYGAWKDDAMRPLGQGGWLLQRHQRMLDSLWNVWLIDRYGTHAALATAWSKGSTTPGQGQVLQQGGFENGTFSAPWSLELHNGAQATASIGSQSVFAGSYAGRLQVSTVTGTDWHIQLKNTGFSLKKDSLYMLNFAARANANLAFNVSAMRDNAPYTWYGGAAFTATPVWQIFSFTFKATEDVLNAGRISISPGNSIGTFFFDAFTLAPPVLSGLEGGESLTSRTIRRILYSKRFSYTDQRVADMAEFYTALERRHFQDLRTYLKNTLGVVSPITGTNALTGPAGASANADMDYLDDHSYWDHPAFPRGGWDAYWWTINNAPMVKTDVFGAITNIFGGLSLQNKPYTISEYNHAFPNRYRSEMVPALLAYSGFHGADGVMWFDYNSGFNWELDMVDGFFQIHRDHSIMALFPACAYAFRKGLVAEADAPLSVQYSKNWIAQMPKKDGAGRWGKYYPYDPKLALTYSIRTTTYDAAQATDFDALLTPSNGPFTTQNGETTLDPAKGVLTTGTPYFCAMSGFLKDAGNLRTGNLQLLQANEFGALTWVALGDAPLQQAARSLLTLSTKLQNTNMTWDGLQTVHDKLGNAPTLMAPAVAALRLFVQADSIRLFPLDATGKEGPGQTFAPSGNGYFDITLDQNRQKTLWWGMRAFGKSITSAPEPPAQWPAKIYPNPITGGGKLFLELDAPDAGPVHLTFVNTAGQIVLYAIENVVAGKQTIQVAFPELPTGAYQYHLRTEAGAQVGSGQVVVRD